MRRFVTSVAAAAVASTTWAVLGAAPTTAGAADRAVDLVARGDYDRYFSPNDDGVRDRFRLAYRLSERADVRVEVRNEHGFRVHGASLGRLAGGDHVWRWAGGANATVPLPDGRYVVLVKARVGEHRDSIQARTTLIRGPDAGQLLTSRLVVYPAADAVRDRFQAVYVREDYSPWADEYPGYFEGLKRLHTRFVVKAPDGRRIADVLHSNYRPVFVWAARDGDGEPLPPGTYRLRVTVKDLAGNVHTMRRTVEVSSAQLAEQTWSVSMPAAEADLGAPALYPPSCNGCPEVCAPAPSERYTPGGLSFRPCDFGYATVQWFGATPPVAPAPVDSFRLTAVGGPPSLGGAGIGYLSDVAIGPGEDTASTPWTKVDLTHYPFVPGGDQPVRWGFSTRDDNEYDVATFTVDYRHWVPVS